MTIIKILWGFLINLDILGIILGILGVFIAMQGSEKLGLFLINLCIFAVSLVVLLPSGVWILTFLENRYPPEQTLTIDQDIKGFIFLGGQCACVESTKRGFTIHNEGAGALINFLSLVKKYPDKKILFAGNAVEIANIKPFFESFEIEKKRIQYIESNTTYENAYKSFAILKPSKEDKWVLVTNAFHMSRSIGLFEKAGWVVQAYPIAYYTTGAFLSSFYGTLRGLNVTAWRVGIKELAGLTNNYLEGYSDSFLPKTKN